MPEVGDNYVCAHCGGTFKANRSDDEALAEYRENFPGVEDEMEIICDHCYKLLVTPDNLRVIRALYEEPS